MTTQSEPDLKSIELRLSQSIIDRVEQRAGETGHTRDDMLALLIGIGLSASEPIAGA